MKQPYKITFVVLSVMLLLAAGPLSAMATTAEPAAGVESDMQENEEMTNASTEDDEVINNDVSTNTEQNEDALQTETTELESSTGELGTEETEQTSETTENVSELDMAEDYEGNDMNQPDDKDKNETNQPDDKDENETESSEEEDVIDWEQLLSGTGTKSGLYYYLQKYQYDCEAVYLNKYVEYMTLQVTACEKMYELGDTTETVLKSYKAQKALAEADLQIAYNESAYNNLYLTKNNLDYSDYNMKELKSVQSIEYYIENYPEKDYMTMARYVTDYNNAVAGMEAKKVEINTLETDVTKAKMLLEAGEISQLEYSEKEVALAKAQFELEQQYVAMHVSYWQLMMLCE